jgi:hypothetical protein
MTGLVRLLAKWVQNADCPAYIEVFAHPAWHCRSRMEMEPVGVVPRHEDLYRIDGHFGRQRDLGHEPAVPAAGGARGEPDSPGQPGGAGGKAAVPAAPGIELADELEQAGGGRVEVGR